MHQDIKITFPFLFLIVFGVLSISCDDRTINAYEDQKGIFSVYGALDVDDNLHKIRVRNLLEPFQSDSSYPIDATVTFTNLSSGESIELQDTVIFFSENKVHNYRLYGSLELDTKYQLTVERSDGITAQSMATTPGLTVPVFHPKDSPNDTLIFCETPLDIYFKNAPPPEYLRVDVGVQYQTDTHWAKMEIVGNLRYDTVLDAYYVLMAPRNLLVEVFPPILPDNPYFDRYLLQPTVSCDEIDERVITMRYTHFGPEWRKGQEVDHRPIVTDSGVVENGLGFFGAYRVDEFEIRFQPNPD